MHYSKWLQNIALIEDTCILLCWNIHVCNSIHNIILTYRIYLLLTDLRKTLNSCWIRFQQSRDTYRSSLQKIFVRSFETNINVQHFTLTLYDICGEILKEFCLCARSMNSYLMNRHTATKSLKLVFPKYTFW